MNIYPNLSKIKRRLGIDQPRLTEFAFILGAMKAGTTTLYGYLAQHPDVCRCSRKEPHFWSESQEPADIDEYYRLWLPQPGRRQIALEASTGYTKTPRKPNVAERLQRLPGRKTFLYLVRDPVDRIESHIAHNIARGRLTIAEALSADEWSRYVSVSSYALQIENYRVAFPETPVKILDFDRLKADPLSVVREACGALDIDPEFPFRLMQPKNTRKTDHGAKNFRLTADLANALRANLADDMRRFQKMSGFDITRWGFDRA